MNELYPIIRRKRRPLVSENPESLKPESASVLLDPIGPPLKKPEPDDVKVIATGKTK